MLCFQTLLTWCCGEDKQQIKDISILSHVLLDWRIWHKALPAVWEKLLRQLDSLLSSGDYVNVRAFADAKAIIKILYTSKVSSRAQERLHAETQSTIILLYYEKFYFTSNFLLAPSLRLSDLFNVCTSKHFSACNIGKQGMGPGNHA